MKFSILQRGLAVIAASACFASTAPASPTVDVKGSDLVIQYTPLDDLSNLPLLTGKHPSGVKITGLDTAITSRTLRLPVKGGTLDLGNGAGQLILGGGLVYTRKIPGRTFKVTFSELIADLTFNITTAPGTPPTTTITFGGSVSAMMTVDGKIFDRVTLWTMDEFNEFYFPEIPITGSYQKANFSIGSLTPPPAVATALATALGTPDGFNAGLTFGDLLIRVAFKPQ